MHTNQTTQAERVSTDGAPTAVSTENEATQDGGDTSQERAVDQQNAAGGEGPSGQELESTKASNQEAKTEDQELPDHDLEDAEDYTLPEPARRKLSKVQREARNLRERLAEAKTETAKTELQLTRLEVAYQSGLPPESVKFLTGNNKAELEENAADLLAMLGLNGRVTPSGTPRELGTAGANNTPEVTPDIDAIGQRIYGGQ